MSVVDEKLVVNDVCSMFGSHIKYLVQLQLTVPVFPNPSHQCGDAIERLYYSAGYEDIYIFCATTSDLVQSLPDSVYPVLVATKQTKRQK